ncbi:hypothetical protein ACFRCX_30365 [Streptomyces sp. NPDC056652]|uniref:hypothetical protein n=1 Tax=Streptomyces sp. NPDC056652 TaxID=3345893 RepID=UPI00368864D1
MGAQLATTVYVQDPETHQTVCLQPGTLPEPHLAALVTNPSAWVDGKLPRLPKAQDRPAAAVQDDASGGASDGSEPADTLPTEPEQGNDDEGTKPAAKKTAAKKTAATRTAAN